MSQCLESKFINPDLKKSWLSDHTPQTVTGIIYIIQMGDKPIFKIGVTNSVNSRISSLQVGNPYKLKAVAAFAVIKTYSEEVEKKAHIVASGLGERMSGEWFSISLDDAISSVELAASSTSTKLISMDRLEKYTDRVFDVAHKQDVLESEEKRRAELRMKLGIE